MLNYFKRLNSIQQRCFGFTHFGYLTRVVKQFVLFSFYSKKVEAATWLDE